MNITVDLKERKVRADSLAKDEACVDSYGSLFLVLRSNPHNLTVKTKRGGYLPKVLVANLSTSTLGFLKRDEMVTPVELKLIAKG